MLTIRNIDYIRSKERKQTYVFVDCECGTKNHSTEWNKVKRYETKSCGCLKNLKGKKYKSNKIIEHKTYCEIYTLDENKFIFDTKDLNTIKKYFWYNHNGYLTHSYTEYGKTCYESFHRMITNAKENDIVDHINRNTYDNRAKNLRITDKVGNARNHNLSSNNTSGCSGVCWDNSRNKWSATIMVKGKTVNLGRYNSKEDAIAVRHKAEIQYFGEYSPLYGGN